MIFLKTTSEIILLRAHKNDDYDLQIEAASFRELFFLPFILFFHVKNDEIYTSSKKVMNHHDFTKDSTSI